MPMHEVSSVGTFVLYKTEFSRAVVTEITWPIKPKIFTWLLTEDLPYPDLENNIKLFSSQGLQ